MPKQEDKWGHEKSLEILRDGQPDGLGTKSNLRDWTDIAKRNSFSQAASKAQSRHSLSADGCKSDLKGDSSDDWRVPHRDNSKDRYWAEPINKAAVPNTYTRKGGSTRD